MSETWTYAGVARRGDHLKFRVSNREGYDTLLQKEGDTDIIWGKLPRPMTVKEAAEYQLGQPAFHVAEVRKTLADVIARRGDRLKLAREQRGFSIKEAADALGLDKGTVWGHEVENRMPQDGLAGYAQLYRVSERWIREGGSGGPDDDSHEPAAEAPTPAKVPGKTVAELLALARQQLAAEHGLDDELVEIDVRIKFKKR